MSRPETSAPTVPAVGLPVEQRVGRPESERAAVDRLMKRCQIGVGGRNALDDAHSIMAECYGVLGRQQIAVESLRARVLELEAQCEAGAASEQRWIDWLVATGLLHYHNACHRPDGSHGPAWVLRTPSVIDGDSCAAWHAYSAAGALGAFLKTPNARANARP